MNLLKYAKKENYTEKTITELQKILLTLKKFLMRISLKSDEKNVIIVEKEKHLTNLIQDLENVIENGITEEDFKRICQQIRIYEIKFADLKGVRF